MDPIIPSADLEAVASVSKRKADPVICTTDDPGIPTILHGPAINYAAALDIPHPHQCEVCDTFYCPAHPEACKRYCCDDCRSQADENRRIRQLEAKQQCELYGDDLDSWYR